MLFPNQNVVETEPQRSRFSRRDKTFLTVAIGVPLLLVGAFLWWQEANRLPVIVIPTPTLPNPNGFDHYVRASRMIRSKVAERGVSDSLTFTIAQRKADLFSSTNEAAVQEMRAGFRYPSRRAPMRTFDVTMPELANFRNFGRYLASRARLQSDLGRNGEAVETLTDGLHFANESARGGTLLPILVSYAVNAIQLDQYWRIAPKLSATEARSVAGRLESLQRKLVPLSEVMREEKWATAAALRQLYMEKSVWSILQGYGMRPSDWREWIQAARLLLVNKGDVLRNQQKYMDETIARSQLTWADQRRMPPPKVPKDPINAILLPVIEPTTVLDFANRTNLTLALYVAALRAFQAENGIYPQSLAELKNAKILTALPADPFAPKSTDLPRYRRIAPNKYLLYSVGPDMKDDAGNAVKPVAGAMRTTLKPNTLGDWVVGENLK